MQDEHSNRPSAADHVGQAAGGITGALAGTAIGVTAGPIGILLGGIAGAIGGWWSGRAIAEAAEDITEADERYYRKDFEKKRATDFDYEHARRAYYFGDVAAANPEYAEREFEQVESDLSRGWSADSRNLNEWENVRRYASVGFSHGRERRRKPRS